MARPRKPGNVLELKGAFKRNPARGKARENEPKPNGEIGDPPTHYRRTLLSAGEK